MENGTKNLNEKLIFVVANVIGKLRIMNKNDNQLPSHPISVTRNEALFLDDSLTLMIENSPETQHVRPMRPISPVTGGGVPAPVELIQKIGKAVLYTCNVTNQNKEYLMYLDEFELLILREVCFSHVKYGAEMVGFSLKRKIHECLLAKDLRMEEELNEILFNIEQSKDIYGKQLKDKQMTDEEIENVKKSVDKILKDIDDNTAWKS